MNQTNVTQRSPRSQEGAVDRDSLPHLFISVSSDRAKWFLDSAVYDDLKLRFNIRIFGQLSTRPEIVERYGGPNVQFEPEIGGLGHRKKLAYRMLIAARSLGFKYRMRNAELGLVYAWHRTINYKQMRPLIRRSRSRKWVLTLFAWLASRSISWRAMRRIGYRQVVDRQFERTLLRDRPAAVLLTGQETAQELCMALASDRHEVRSILVPVSPDDIYDRGYLMAEYSHIVCWGAEFRDRLERLHGVEPVRFANIGMLISRLQEQLLESYSTDDERRALGIPAGKRIVSYLSVDNYEAADTAASVTALADAIDDGVLNDVVVVLRTSPWEDADAASAMFKDNPHVRIQNAGEKPFDAPGTGLLARHAALVQASSVIVMGSITSSLFQAAAWGIPSVLDRSGQDPETRSSAPMLFEDTDVSGMIGIGMAATRTTTDLVDVVKRYLESPGHDADVWRAIAAKLDFQDSEYVENFAKLIG